MSNEIYIRLSSDTAIATMPEGSEELAFNDQPNAVAVLTAQLLKAANRPKAQELLFAGIEALRSGLAVLVATPNRFADADEFANHILTLTEVATEIGGLRECF